MLISIGFPLQSRHRLQHQRGHDGDFRVDNHRVLKSYVTGDSPPVEKPCEKQYMYTEIHNPDSPSDNSGIPLSGMIRRKPCYAPQVEAPLSAALSVSKPQEIREHLLYPDESGRVPDCTNNYNSWAQAESESRTYLQSHHSSLSLHRQSKRWFARYWLSQSLLQQNLSY